MNLEIIKYPNSLLNEYSKPIIRNTNKIKELANNMLETMYANNGIGLAAPQVGILKRLIVVDVEYLKQIKDKNIEYSNMNPYIMINPTISYSSDDLTDYTEGCLSIPDTYKSISRPRSILVRYQDIDGKAVILEATNLLARCIQHEIDHLNGILFTEK